MMLYKSVIVCVSNWPTPAAYTNNVEKLPVKWKVSFIIHIN